MNHLVEIYYIIDEIVRVKSKKFQRGRKSKLTVSETLTILVIGHSWNLQTHKQIYDLACLAHSKDFNLPSYAQFVKAVQSAEPYIADLLNLLAHLNFKSDQELFFIDSSALPVNGYDPETQPKWGQDLPLSKNMHGWYRGFKVHIVVNNLMQIVSVKVTLANIADCRLLEDVNFVKPVQGKLVGDKGYHVLQPVRDQLLSKNIELIARQRNNMDPYLNEYYAPFLQRRRCIEGIFGRCKTRFAPIFPFVRSVVSFMAHAKAAMLTLIIKDLLS